MMSASRGASWRTVLQQPETQAVLVTTDGHGEIDTIRTETLHLDPQGHLVYLEYFESLQTNRNLVRSLWFEKKIAVTLLAGGGQTFHLKGIPRRAMICGPIFEAYYRAAHPQLPDADLSTVWIIEILEVRQEDLGARQREQDQHHAIVAHLDRFAK